MKQRIGLQQIDYSEIGMGQVVWANPELELFMEVPID